MNKEENSLKKITDSVINCNFVKEKQVNLE